jgi:hypothetical protein
MACKDTCQTKDSDNCCHKDTKDVTKDHPKKDIEDGCSGPCSTTHGSKSHTHC